MNSKSNPSTMQVSPLSFDRVSKFYNSHAALSLVSFQMPERGIVGLVGRNGAGKTTLLNIAAGLVIPASGEALTLGEPAPELSEKALARMGVVPHKPQFMEALSAEEYLRIIANFYPTWDWERVGRLYDALELAPQKYIASYSEGQRQKLAIVAAVGHHPSLLLMDEPMSNLDPIARSETIRMLWQVIEEDEALVVFSSHILADVEKVADWVTCLDKGQVQAHQSLDDLRESFVQWTLHDPERKLSESELVAEKGVLDCKREAGVLRVTFRAGAVDASSSLWQSLPPPFDQRCLTLDEIFPILCPPQSGKSGKDKILAR
jgi:ABC-2 type transport system ATP-binding protein